MSNKVSFDDLIAGGVDINEAKLATTVFFIEANSFEQLMLWKEHKDETNWKEDSSGFYRQIGNIDKGKPVTVSFNFAEIYGKRICFYYVSSRYADYTMVEDWFKENYPVKYDGDSRLAMTDAMNFHHAIGCCRDNR